METEPAKKAEKKEKVRAYQSGNDTIIQPTQFKDNTASQTVINIVIGLVIGNFNHLLSGCAERAAEGKK